MDDKKRKYHIPILVAAIAVVGILIPAAMLSSCADTAAEPPTSPVESVESKTSSTESIKVTVPEIKPTAPTSKKESSEPVSDLTVDGDPEADVSSKAESEPASGQSSSKAESKPASQTESKPVSSTVESESQPSSDPNNPTDGTTKVEDGKGYIFIEGQWWEDYSYGQQTVDDSDKTYPPCPDCGREQGYCICRVGY